MQADEFEKKIQAKMEEFELVPDSEVWKQVSTRIRQEKKKRRVVVYWLFAGLALLVGTLSFWLINNENNTKLVLNKANNNVSKVENYKLKQKAPDFSKDLKKAQKVYLKKDIVYLRKSELKRVLTTETKNTFQSKIVFTKDINRKFVLPQQKKYNNIYKEDKKYVQKLLPPHKFYNPDLEKPTAPLENTKANEKTDFKKDTSANTITKELLAKKQASKKWNFGFTIYSGVSDNVSNLLESQYKSLINASPISSGNAGNYNYNVNAASNFKKGFSFGLGIFVKKQFTKRVSLSAGIDYHLYSVKSAVGSRVNQPVSFYDSYLLNPTSVNSYYTIGDSSNSTFTNPENYSNNYHFVQLPINFGYQINRNQEKPILISAGITPGYLIGTNALYANPLARVLYVDKEKFHHFQLSAQSNFLFPVSASHKFNLSAGPMVQYGLINATKAVTGDSQHLLFAGIKVNISLK